MVCQFLAIDCNDSINSDGAYLVKITQETSCIGRSFGVVDINKTLLNCTIYTDKTKRERREVSFGI